MALLHRACLCSAGTASLLLAVAGVEGAMEVTAGYIVEPLTERCLPMSSPTMSPVSWRKKLSGRGLGVGGGRRKGVK